MRSLYDILTRLSYIFLWVSQFFSTKMKLFINGRKGAIDRLKASISPSDKTIWFHCASLGEFEQGRPVMNAVKKLLPEHKILVTFFSPSGYEAKKHSEVADYISYLPIDTASNARKFIAAIRPVLAVFIKYEFWPNYLFELKRQRVPAILISGLFRKNQVFFSGYGGFMRRCLKTIDHFFVQDTSSLELLRSIGIECVTISGDTRFDRVSQQIEQNNELSFADDFIQDSLCVVCGSTWPEDETLLIPYINKSKENVKFIIAPHIIDKVKIDTLKRKLTKSVVVYSELETSNLSEAKVLIIDTIGLLTRLYSYAHVAYVGGAMGNTGLHNILEPATFGVPVVIGKNFSKFPEATRMQSLAALFSIATFEELAEIFDKLLYNSEFRNKAGLIAEHYVNRNTGATAVITAYIKELHTNGQI